jgi:hypothetical protein
MAGGVAQGIHCQKKKKNGGKKEGRTEGGTEVSD